MSFHIWLGNFAGCSKERCELHFCIHWQFFAASNGWWDAQLLARNAVRKLWFRCFPCREDLQNYSLQNAFQRRNLECCLTNWYIVLFTDPFTIHHLGRNSQKRKLSSCTCLSNLAGRSGGVSSFIQRSCKNIQLRIGHLIQFVVS
jgi:hypothetical protein